MMAGRVAAASMARASTSLFESSAGGFATFGPGAAPASATRGRTPLPVTSR